MKHYLRPSVDFGGLFIFKNYENVQMLNNPLYLFKKRVRTLIGNSFKRACKGFYKKR